jgi:hypothetical protein
MVWEHICALVRFANCSRRTRPPYASESLVISLGRYLTTHMSASTVANDSHTVGLVMIAIAGSIASGVKWVDPASNDLIDILPFTFC